MEERPEVINLQTPRDAGAEARAEGGIEADPGAGITGLPSERTAGEEATVGETGEGVIDLRYFPKRCISNEFLKNK